MSLRDSIFAADDIIKEQVEVPEWGLTVEVRSMTGAERTRILDLSLEDGEATMDLKKFYPEVVIASTFDPATGEQVFRPDDRDAIQAKNAVAVDRLATVGLRLGGFSQESADAEGKDSSATTDTASSSD